MTSSRRSSESEPKRRASSKTIINKKLSANVISSISASVIIIRINRSKQHTINLSDISDNGVSMLILNPAGAIRQSNHRHTARVSVRNDLLAETLSTNTFLIISENNGVKTAIKGIMNEREELVKKIVVIRCIVIKVESKDLVILSNNASFSSSRVVRENKTAGVNVKLEE